MTPRAARGAATYPYCRRSPSRNPPPWMNRKTGVRGGSAGKTNRAVASILPVGEVQRVRQRPASRVGQVRGLFVKGAPVDGEALRLPRWRRSVVLRWRGAGTHEEHRTSATTPHARAASLHRSARDSRALGNPQRRGVERRIHGRLRLRHLAVARRTNARREAQRTSVSVNVPTRRSRGRPRTEHEMTIDEREGAPRERDDAS
jgi:hypothetical protein